MKHVSNPQRRRCAEMMPRPLVSTAFRWALRGGLRYCAACLLASVLMASPAHAEDKSGVSPDRVKLPKGPGSLEGIGENAQPNLSM